MTQNTLWQPSDINAEGGAEGGGGGEQDSPKRRGRIPQSAWPQILERYRAGATLSAIAREFECTPSAISYIVRKAEASGGTAAADGAETPAETSGEKPAEKPAEKPVEAAAQPVPAAPPVAEAPAPRPPRRAPEAPRPAAAEAAPKPAEAPRASEAPRPAEAAPKTRLELKPAPAPEPVPAPAPPAAAPAAAPSAAAGEPGAAPAPRPAGAQPTPPVDEVEARLRETARGCLAAYRTWRQQPGQGSIQTLADAVHDLRKALARIEIDMSASRRDEQVARPIPIPAHRAARRPQ